MFQLVSEGSFPKCMMCKRNPGQKKYTGTLDVYPTTGEHSDNWDQVGIDFRHRLLTDNR